VEQEVPRGDRAEIYPQRARGDILQETFRALGRLANIFRVGEHGKKHVASLGLFPRGSSPLGVIINQSIGFAFGNYPFDRPGPKKVLKHDSCCDMMNIRMIVLKRRTLKYDICHYIHITYCHSKHFIIIK